jgi:hypothetical protein
VTCSHDGILSHAERIQLERKRRKLKQFIGQNSDTKDLLKNIDQLRAFASSTRGLIIDSNREKIWPVLAQNFPFVQRYQKINDKYDGFVDVKRNIDDEGSSHDSDFESALSTISSADLDRRENDDDSFSEESSDKVILFNINI